MLVAAARSLYATAYNSLAKYAPLDATAISGYYAKVPDENLRYDIVRFWHERIRDYDDKTSLMNLIDLFEQMAVISTRDGNSGYIANDARSFEDQISSKIVQLYPYFEGTYEVAVTCEQDAGVPASACGGGFIDRLVIMDTLANGGHVEISMANHATGTMVYAFSNVIMSQGLSLFEATDTPFGVPSQLHVKLDRATGTITGWVRNTDTQSTLHLTGKLLASPAQVFDAQAANPNREALAVEKLSGSFKGTYAGRNVGFEVMSFGQDRYGATMSFDDLPGYRLRFQVARFYPKLGVLVMVGAGANGAHVKLTAYFHQVEGGKLMVTGLGFTDQNGAVQNLTLESVAH
jgi:hypothetical protein